MNRQDFKRLVRWFERYVSGFFTGNREADFPVRLKKIHTHRVCAQISFLARELDLTPADGLLARTSALLHDIGRFRQYRQYGTFNDRTSCDHAELGLSELAAHEVLSVCPAAEADLIRDAIRFHNAAQLPADSSGRARFFMRLLRDADKLDIWKVFCDHYRESGGGRNQDSRRAVVQNLPDLPRCAPPVLAALNEGRFARLEDLRTLADLKLLQISWVYDLNFAPAFKRLRERRYIEQLAAELPRTAEVQSAVAKCIAYAESCADMGLSSGDLNSGGPRAL